MSNILTEIAFMGILMMEKDLLSLIDAVLQGLEQL